MAPRYVMTIDSTRCMNCKACVVACQQRNGVPYEHSRNWVLETKDESRLGGMSFQPGACMHCDNPVCVGACPTKATYKAEDGSVVIDKERCIGCGGCIAACPYAARFRHPVSGTADKCDYCRSSAVTGHPPACVLACSTGCRSFGDANDASSPVADLLGNNRQIKVTPINVDTKPSLTYLGYTAPGNFPDVAGKGEVPAPLAVIPTLATGVKILAGLSLFGVIGVFLKQLVLPSDDEKKEHGENA